MEWLDLFANLIITWGIGLSPALVARYLIVKQPIKSKSATWIAGLSSLFFYFAFRVFLAFIGGDEPGPGLVWVFVFFASRWIMVRGYHDGLLQRIDARLADSQLGSDERAKLEKAKARFTK